MRRSFNLFIFIAFMFLFGSCLFKTSAEAQTQNNQTKWGIAQIEAYSEACYSTFGQATQKYLVVVVNIITLDSQKKVFYQDDLIRMALGFNVVGIEHLQNQRFSISDDKPFKFLDEKVEEGRKKQIEARQRVSF